MDPALREAVLSAQNIQAPASPLGADSGAELGNLYAASFQLPQAKAAVGAQAQNAQEQVKQNEYAAKIKAQKEADKADPKAYKIVRKADGGYDFFDPDGQQVDIATYSQRTGVNPVEVLKKSDNPIDRQYINDYNNLQSFIDAVTAGDVKKVQEYVKTAKTRGVDLQKYNTKNGINDLVAEFTRAYRRYYSPDWGANVPDQPVVGPAYSQNEINKLRLGGGSGGGLSLQTNRVGD